MIHAEAYFPPCRGGDGRRQRRIILLDMPFFGLDTDVGSAPKSQHKISFLPPYDRFIRAEIETEHRAAVSRVRGEAADSLMR